MRTPSASRTVCIPSCSCLPGLRVSFIQLLGLFESLWLFLAVGCSGPEPTVYEYDPIDTSQEPIQTSYTGDEYFRLEIEGGSFTIRPVASYRVSALVVGKKHYLFGWESDLSPFDLALAWGKLADPEYDKEMTYSLADRWYYYCYRPRLGLNASYVSSHSSNNHIIPSSENVLNAIGSIGKKEKITVDGFLVNVTGSYKGNRIFWNTSLSRKDTGNGSCEVFYVKRVKVGDRVYE